MDGNRAFVCSDNAVSPLLCLRGFDLPTRLLPPIAPVHVSSRQCPPLPTRLLPLTAPVHVSSRQRPPLPCLQGFDLPAYLLPPATPVPI
ncbi:hypothetical protein ACLOJK_038610 [Asimina triloba]